MIDMMPNQLTSEPGKNLPVFIHNEDGDIHNLAASYLAQMRTAASRKSMASALRGLSRVFLGIVGIAVPEDSRQLWKLVPWHLLTPAAADLIIGHTTGAPATRTQQLAALRGVARAGFRAGVIAADTYMAIRETKGVRGSRLLSGREIHDDEVASLLATCDGGKPIDIRDRAVIVFAAATGARRAEIAALMMEDIQSDRDGEMMGRIIGKGNKERAFVLAGGARDAMAAWIETRGDDPGPVFCRMRRGSHMIPSSGITTTALQHMLTQRAEASGVANITWHDFRRTLAGDLLSRGADMATVARILGHSNVATTQRYDRRGLKLVRQWMAEKGGSEMFKKR